MKEYFQKILAQKGLQLSLVLIIIIIVINVVLMIFYRQAIISSSESAQKVDIIKEQLKQSDFYIFQGDVGVRGFLLQPTDDFLAPYITAKDNYKSNLEALEQKS
jgi:CHASE3 domain sensor protein